MSANIKGVCRLPPTESIDASMFFPMAKLAIYHLGLYIAHLFQKPGMSCRPCGQDLEQPAKPERRCCEMGKVLCVEDDTTKISLNCLALDDKSDNGIFFRVIFARPANPIILFDLSIASTKSDSTRSWLPVPPDLVFAGFCMEEQAILGVRVVPMIIHLPSASGRYFD